MSLLAVDLGFGNVKYKAKDRCGIFRSAFSLDRKRFGDEVLSGSRAVQANTVEELITLFPAVINNLSKELSIDYFDVALGLPLEAWKDKGIQVAVYDAIFHGVKNIQDIYIYPQAAAFGVLQNNDCLVVDIGHNTVITSLIIDKKVAYDKTFFRKGAVEIALQVNEIIKHELSRTGKTLTTVELDEIALRGRFQNGLDIIDISEQVRSIKTNYIKNVLSMVISDIKANAGIVNFDTLYLIGGLAKDVQIQSQKVKVIVPEQSIFANVNAFYELASLKIKL